MAIVPKLLGLSVFEANVKGAKEVAPSLNETIDYTASVDASGPDQAAVIMGLVHSNNPPQGDRVLRQRPDVRGPGA